MHISCLKRCVYQLGLAVQLYHDIGSKQLIETLHSNRFCASYGEVRRYLTSIAHHEIENIQDINTETVDGKNTFHSMARAVFQIRHYAVDPNISQSKKKRSQERSVQIINSASSLTACLAFSKSKGSSWWN